MRINHSMRQITIVVSFSHLMSARWWSIRTSIPIVSHKYHQSSIVNGENRRQISSRISFRVISHIHDSVPHSPSCRIDSGVPWTTEALFSFDHSSPLNAHIHCSTPTSFNRTRWPGVISLYIASRSTANRINTVYINSTLKAEFFFEAF